MQEQNYATTVAWFQLSLPHICAGAYRFRVGPLLTSWHVIEHTRWVYTGLMPLLLSVTLLMLFVFCAMFCG